MREFDVMHYELPPEFRSGFAGGIPDGHFPVIVLTPDNGSTCATLPIEG
jgi:hypothetical protein